MNRFLKTSICTIALGLASIASTEGIKIDTSKYTLEVAIDNTKEAAAKIKEVTDNTNDPSKNLYISPDGYYSLAHNPKVFDLSNPSHEVYPMGGYKDTYYDRPGRFIVIERMDETGDLEQLYKTYSKFYIQYVSETITTYLRPGRRIVPMPMSPLQRIIVDNHPAIRGDIEFMVTDSEGNKLSAPQHYLQITVSQNKKDTYGFIFFNRIPRGSEMQPEAINDILESFHALK